ncbi:porin family protein [Chryseobacterium sp. JUb7]|uniref:porin family protein n=1 Tax=Chryseobacterium sp. JUb7 TaxID=2940599 RepID=UPI0021676FD1|nr:porin family protein [Chryseobacterium sp. JUb7]MCS3529691.1 opacity protein-like surface antigen [Chryseobacterium sp. JUb7]
MYIIKKNLAVALLLSAAANAQNTQEKINLEPTSDSKVSFGIKGGYSLSQMKFFDSKLDSKSYFYAGIVAEQPVSSKVSIQAEALCTQLGGKQAYSYLYINDPDMSIVDNTIEFDYQLTQIQIPVSVKYYFIPNLSASVGMNFGINISEKVKTDEIVNGSTSRNYENIKTLNLFPFLGAEYKLTDNFFVDARYHFNFIEVNKGALPTKIGFLQAGVGYRFK